jgi:hypothetical protein
VPSIGRVLAKRVCGVGCLRLGVKIVARIARDWRYRPISGLERKPTPQTLFTMPLEVGRTACCFLKDFAPTGSYTSLFVVLFLTLLIRR